MNPLDLPGPQFLLFYIVLAGLAIGSLVFLRRRAELYGATPRIDLSNPYLIACLRGGKGEVLRVAVVGLLERGLLVLNGTKIQSRENASSDSVRWPIEKALLKKYKRSGEAQWIFYDDALLEECQACDKTLRQARLLPDQATHQARWLRLIVVCGALITIGLIKIGIALSLGRTNVGFLIVLMILAVIVAFKLSFPRLTASGKAMIADVRSLYGGLRNRTARLKPAGSDMESTMQAAIFGVGMLPFPEMDILFPSEKRTSASSSSGSDSGWTYFGSSCSSSGSSCSSSSSSTSSCSSGGSSGSSCGSGCGGCGGS